MINVSDEVLYTKTADDTELVFERQRQDLWRDLLPAEAQTLLANGMNAGLVRALYPLDLHVARERLLSMLYQGETVRTDFLHTIKFWDWLERNWQRHSLSMRRLTQAYATVAPFQLGWERVAELMGLFDAGMRDDMYERLDLLAGRLAAWAGAEESHLKLIDTGLMSNGVEYLMTVRDYVPKHLL